MRPEVGKVLTKEQVLDLQYGNSDSPQKILGSHYIDGGQVISFYHPKGKQAWVVYQNEEYEMENVEKTNIFSAYVPHRNDMPYYIKMVLEDNTIIRKKDPYSFKVQIKRYPLELWEEGKWKHVYRYLGAHPMMVKGVPGIHFAVWAPNARRVSVVGDFNNWDGRMYPMIRRSIGGIFELFIPEIKEGGLYKFEIKTKQGDVYLKSDPYANAYEVAPKNASVITNLNAFQWTDKRWMEARKDLNIYKSPVVIYEVHLGSWKRAGEHGERFLTYRELAVELAEHAKKMGFTHLEILGVMEHLREETMGHEILGFYAPTSRFGSLSDLQYMINYLHEQGIGVILDWAPAGITKDEAGMTGFDGTNLYESTDPKKQELMKHNNAPFDYSKIHVQNYMLSNLRFWMEDFHVDGFRIAVLDSLIFEGIYQKNELGREFLKLAADTIYNEKNGCIVITQKLTKELSDQVKPTFQWAGDHIVPLIQHVQKEGYAEREQENQQINRFEKLNNTEQDIIKISHRFSKKMGSVIEQMPGDPFSKYANMRMIYAFIIGMKGKKHIFMGNEFAQWRAWNIHQSLDWHVLEEASNQKTQLFVEELNAFYAQHSVLYATDYDEEGLEWLTKEGESEIVSFSRKHKDTGEELLFICNFTPMNNEAFKLGVSKAGEYSQIFSTDEQKYGGLGLFDNQMAETKEEELNGYPYTLTLQIPKQSVIVLEKKR